MESGILVGDESLYFNEFDEPNRDNIFRRVEFTKKICEQRLDKLKKFLSDETSSQF